MYFKSLSSFCYFSTEIIIFFSVHLQTKITAKEVCENNLDLGSNFLLFQTIILSKMCNIKLDRVFSKNFGKICE